MAGKEVSPVDQAVVFKHSDSLIDYHQMKRNLVVPTTENDSSRKSVSGDRIDEVISGNAGPMAHGLT
jgi:hypothetical protein